MATASNELINMLTEFFLNEIGSKAIDGITYAMVLKKESDREAYNKYMKIRKEAQKCGFSANEAFRVYEVANGYIFDMDLSVAKKISFELTKAVNKTNGGATPATDLIGSMPDERRKSDMMGLAKFVKQSYDSGERVIEVALFNKNSTQRIMVTGIGTNNEMLMVKYNAYAIRPWDIEIVNKAMLIPAGIRVSAIEPCEILPSKHGVKFKLYLESAA